MRTKSKVTPIRPEKASKKKPLPVIDVRILKADVAFFAEITRDGKVVKDGIKRVVSEVFEAEFPDRRLDHMASEVCRELKKSIEKGKL